MIKCSICGEEIEEDRSNNAWPINEGRCCGMCNEMLVAQGGKGEARWALASFVVQIDQSCQECQHASPHLGGIVCVVFDNSEIVIASGEITDAVAVYSLVLKEEINWWG
jgi:hypothetical protein